jgi:hypothetical protein
VVFRLFQQVTVVSLLVLEGLNEGANSFVRLAAVELLGSQGLTDGTDEIKGRGRQAGVQDRRSPLGEVPCHEVVLTFLELQCSTAAVEEIVPQLGVLIHASNESCGGNFCVVWHLHCNCNCCHLRSPS